MFERPAMNDVATDERRAMRQRRLRFRSWHRGLREVDLLLGRYADARLDELSDDELADFENLLDVPDRHVLAWAIGEEPIPQPHDTQLMRSIIAFHRGGGGR